MKNKALIEHHLESDYIFTVGEYSISPSPYHEDKILIYHESGEGGEFSAEKFKEVMNNHGAKLIEAVDKFYKDNF